MTDGNDIGPADRAYLAISPLLAREASASRIMSLALAAAVDLGDAVTGRAFLLDRELRHLACEATHPSALHYASGCSDAVIDIDAPAQTDCPLVYCLRTGQAVLIENIHRYTGFDCARFQEWDPSRTLGPLLAVPVRDHSGAAVGVLALQRQCGTPDFCDTIAAQVRRFTEHVATAVAAARLLVENTLLNRRISELPGDIQSDSDADDPFASIIGNSAPMRAALSLARRVAPTDISVLVLGETGTGKEVLTRAIHQASPRFDGPFVAQNCAAIPETLLEAELFGWVRGAFSGAHQNRAGLFVQATGGTLFLDEIGDMPLGLQAKLLRVLEERRVRPLGSVTEQAVDVRVIAATHNDLEERMRRGAFRSDLYYRLAAFPIDLPPLRQRAEDLPLLVQHLINECRQRHGGLSFSLSRDTLAALESHTWPGNVRELRNAIERAVLLGEDGAAALIALTTRPIHNDEVVSQASLTDWSEWESLPLRDAVTRFEIEFIRRRLDGSGGNQREAARALGLPRRTLADKIRRYRLHAPAGSKSA